MTSDGARLGDGSDPVERLRGRVARLSELRIEGLRLVSDGDAEEIAAWHRRWAALLDEIRTKMDLEPPPTGRIGALAHRERDGVPDADSP